MAVSDLARFASCSEDEGIATRLVNLEPLHTAGGGWRMGPELLDGSSGGGRTKSYAHRPRVEVAVVGGC